MVKRILMTNADIYNNANSMNQFLQECTAELPVKINFYLQKNIKIITDMAQDIDNERTAIIKKYGTPLEDNPDQYQVPEDKVEIAQTELIDLFNLEQEVKFNALNLDDFDGVNMTPTQVQAFSYMFLDEEE